MTQRKMRVRAPSAIVSKRVAELRKKRGWSAQKLADACADQGMPELNRSVIANIESHRRKTVTLEEMTVLALVLDVAPVNLFVPIDESEEYLEQYAVTPDTWVSVSEVRNWVRGDASLVGQDPRTYFSEVPREDFSAVKPSDDDLQQRSDDVREYRRLTAKFGFTDLTDGDD